jgi:hypothetical protein
MELSRSTEAACRSATQELPNILSRSVFEIVDGVWMGE